MGDARKDALRVEFDSRINPVAGRKSACGASNSTEKGLFLYLNGLAAESGERYLGRLQQRLVS